MQDLRLIGVQEDGQHLLLSDSEGERFRVQLDEPLRAAARRDRPRLGQLQIEIDGGMRPREVQALIRAGCPPTRSPTGPAGRWRRSAATRARSSPSASTSPGWPGRSGSARPVAGGATAPRPCRPG